MPNDILLRDKYHDYRRLMDVRAEEVGENGDLILCGIPVEFDKPYKLFEYNGKSVYEVIARGAFDGADYADVPLKYNHGDSKGTPARTTSKTERGRLTGASAPWSSFSGETRRCWISRAPTKISVPAGCGTETAA